MVRASPRLLRLCHGTFATAAAMQRPREGSVAMASFDNSISAIAVDAADLKKRLTRFISLQQHQCY